MQERLKSPLLPESQMVFPSDTDVKFGHGCVRQPGWIAMENLGDEACFMPALSDGGISLAILTGGMIFFGFGCKKWRIPVHGFWNTQ